LGKSQQGMKIDLGGHNPGYLSVHTGKGNVGKGDLPCITGQKVSTGGHEHVKQTGDGAMKPLLDQRQGKKYKQASL
jgi:hypothetical protein